MDAASVALALAEVIQREGAVTLTIVAVTLGVCAGTVLFLHPFGKGER